MSDQPIHQIDLDNGLRVSFFDASKKVAADRYMVRLRFTMPIPVDAQRQNILGPSVTFEQVRERIFVSADQKDSVLDTLLNTCVSFARQYMGHPDFAGRYLDKLMAETKDPK